MKTTKKRIIITIAAMVIVLIFFTLQGAVVIAFNLTGTAARLFPALVVWALVGAAFLFVSIIKMPLSEVGFKAPEKSSLKKLFFLIPLIAIALSGIIGGVDFSAGIDYIFACLCYTLAIAVSEEMFFRGIICNLWKSHEIKAILISSALFGACHALQAMANPDLIRTILAICFAFFYGIAFAQIFLLTKSILPGIILHAFHDFCSFIGKSLSSEADFILGAVQTILILIFIFAVHFRSFKKMKKQD